MEVQEQPALGNLPLPDTESRPTGALEGRVGRLQAVHSGQMEGWEGLYAQGYQQFRSSFSTSWVPLHRAPQSRMPSVSLISL